MMQDQEVETALLDQHEAAKWLGVSNSTVQRERESGRLKFHRIRGWRVKYSLDQLQDYLETYCQPAARPTQKREQAIA